MGDNFKSYTSKGKHGTRATYVGDKCRCDLCKEANRKYAKQRAKVDWKPNPWVSAEKSRRHLNWLSSRGVGKGRVSSVSKLAKSTIQAIKDGKTRKCRLLTQTKILAVTPEDGQFVPIEKFWEIVVELEALGLNEAEICRRIGLETPRLQHKGESVTSFSYETIKRVRDEAKVEKEEQRKRAYEALYEHWRTA
jgi:hypothetical protein